jgi:hypothetical protein
MAKRSRDEMDSATHRHEIDLPAASPAMATDTMSSIADVTVEGHDEIASSEVFLPPERVSAGAHIPSMERYTAMYRQSLEDPSAFWAKHGREMLTWFRPFSDSAV